MPKSFLNKQTGIAFQNSLVLKLADGSYSRTQNAVLFQFRLPPASGRRLGGGAKGQRNTLNKTQGAAGDGACVILPPSRGRHEAQREDQQDQPESDFQCFGDGLDFLDRAVQMHQHHQREEGYKQFVCE